LEIEPTTEEICSSLDGIIGEYYNHASLPDFFDAIETLLIRKHRYRVLERLIEISLEHKNEYRELSSKSVQYFISKNYLTEINVAEAFCNLLDRLADLMLDTPDAPEVIGKFIARADSESCLPKEFIDEERYRAEDSLVKRSLDYCYALTKDQHSVKTCWGTAIGGFTDTSTLSEKIRELLKEFVSSGDKDEATRCLKDLDVPHYHHELVYESILISMESEDDRVINSMTWLLQYMYKEVKFQKINKGE
jgi:programmed cell death protein 4